MLRKGSGFTLYLFLPDGQKKDAAAILNAGRYSLIKSTRHPEFISGSIIN
jgi:hypothetical protein